MKQKTWGGRFAVKTDQLVTQFTSSIAIDRRLYAVDIEASIAHSKMLAQTGVLTEAECRQMVEGLQQVRMEIEEGRFEYDDRLEDIHMHIEARLTELIGDTAAKLHTARSRNDQVAVDLRLWLRSETRAVMAGLKTLRQALVALAAQHTETILPGFTHLQRAQPVILAHHLLAYYEMFTRDSERFADSLKRLDVNPLGAAALAGTPYPIDRDYTSRLLGFSKTSPNSMDAVADRDFIAEALSHAAICMVHLSRMAEELILWASSEFEFLCLPDAFATGSSIMPQKKNPDVAELVRGKSALVIGHLTAILTLLKGLPLTYNRDLQEDKRPLFDGIDTLRASVAVFARMLPALQFNMQRMETAAQRGFLNATDLADYLVTRGVPFRKAHHIVGNIVAHGLDQQKEIHELALESLQTFSDKIEADVFEALTLQTMVDRRGCIGGTARENVTKAVKTAQQQLDLEKE